MYKGTVALYTASPTVEPPITDSLRYGPPLYNGQTTCPLLTFPYIFNSKRQTTSYLQTTDRTRTLIGQVAIQYSLQERTKIEVSDENCCIKYSTFSHSAVPRKYISSVDFCPFRVSAQDC